jgi:hypothetical protein
MRQWLFYNKNIIGIIKNIGARQLKKKGNLNNYGGYGGQYGVGREG